MFRSDNTQNYNKTLPCAQVKDKISQGGFLNLSYYCYANAAAQRTFISRWFTILTIDGRGIKIPILVSLVT